MSKTSKAIPGLAVGDDVWVLDWPVEGRAARARVSWVHKGRPAFRAKVGRGTREYIAHEEGVQWWRTEAAMNAARRCPALSPPACTTSVVSAPMVMEYVGIRPPRIPASPTRRTALALAW